MKPAAVVRVAVPGALALLTFSLSAAPVARACIGDQFASIHFNSGNPDFGTPPRRASLPWRGEEFNRPVHDNYGAEGYGEAYSIELTGDKDAEIEARRKEQNKAFRKRADAAVATGRWTEARAVYAETAKTLGWTGSLRDRAEVIDLMERTQKAGELTPPVKTGFRSYFAALDKLDDGFYKYNLPAAPDPFETLSHDTALPRELRGHAAYQQACAVYATWTVGRAKDTAIGDALLRFVAVSHTFPTVKPEATLLMIARTALLAKDPAQRRPDVAANAIHGLLSRFPKTRLRHAALGLRARLDYLRGRNTEAAAVYFALGDLDSVRWVRRQMPAGAQRDRLDARLLGLYLRQQETARRYTTYANTVKDIDYMLRVLSPAGASLFVQRLIASPETASAYFYYRLYHCENEKTDLRNLVRLADRIAAKDKDAAARFPRGLQTRLAEVYYQRGEYDRALPWVDRALAGVPEGGAVPGGDRALYVRGAIRAKQNRNVSARSDFETLLAAYPGSLLRAGAHEEIALAAEADGDTGAALQQYFYLGYTPDIAYFLDARMTTGDIVRFLRDHPRHPKRALIRYSLGMRYLRQDRFTEARRCFVALSPPVLAAFNRGRRTGANDYSIDTGSPDPLRVIRDLRGLQTTIDTARSADARADAQYRYANYYYTHGTLLLYNAALWDGRRAFNFDFFSNKSHMTGADTAATHRHMYEHEIYARTRKLCLRIVEQSPKTPAAPLALYRAACCESKLSHFNGWWRDDRPNHGLQASRLMKRLVREYPKHALAAHAKKYADVFYREQKPPAE